LFGFAVAIVGTSAMFGTGAAPAADAMAPRDIQSTFFNGEPFTATSPSGTKFKMTFMPDGKVTREPIELSGTKDSGTWKLSAKGFCTTWTRSRPNCFTIIPLADNKWSVERIATTITTRVAVWSK
jgi:hypothetical protein